MALSYIMYISDGMTNLFSIPFPYINKKDIKVYVNDNEVSFTWITESTITLKETPSLDSTILIKRDTNRNSRIVDFKDGSQLDEKTLDLAADQQFYIMQEAFDHLNKAVDPYIKDITILDEAINNTYEETALLHKHCKEFYTFLSDAASGCPVGMLAQMSLNAIPLGWLKADGRSLKVSEYPDLAALYADDEETFNIPDLTQQNTDETVWIIKAYHRPNVKGVVSNLKVSVHTLTEDYTKSYVVFDAATDCLDFYLEKGPIGPVGPQGPQGVQGQQGIQGPQGVQGPQGIQGPKGDQGPQGNIGPTGPTGPRGDVGPKGPTGPIGPQGPRGETGLTGPQGPQGIQGPQGDKGDRGPQGPEGPKGKQGDKGPMGDTPLGLAFGHFRVDREGILCCDFYGEANANDFHIGDDGVLEVNY